MKYLVFSVLFCCFDFVMVNTSVTGTDGSLLCLPVEFFMNWPWWVTRCHLVVTSVPLPDLWWKVKASVSLCHRDTSSQQMGIAHRWHEWMNQWFDEAPNSQHSSYKKNNAKKNQCCKLTIFSCISKTIPYCNNMELKTSHILKQHQPIYFIKTMNQMCNIKSPAFVVLHSSVDHFNIF